MDLKRYFFVFLRGEGEGGRGKGGEVKPFTCSIEIRTSGLQKCVLANYYGTQHSCLENLINSAHHNTRKMVSIKK